MEKSLSFSDVLVGIGVFTLELFKTAVLRFTFIIYVLLVSVVFLPFIAGWIINVLIFTIPISYALFGVPALILGFCISLFMIMFRSYIQKGGFAHIGLGMILAPVMMWIFYYVIEPDLFAKYAADFITNPLSFRPGNDGGHSLWFINIYFLLGAIFGGGAIAGFLQKDVMKDLLAAPTSVKRQLMAYKNKRAI